MVLSIPGAFLWCYVYEYYLKDHIYEESLIYCKHNPLDLN